VTKLTALDVGGEADAWEGAGFTVAQSVVALGQVQLRLDAAHDGITAWHFDGEPAPASTHPNTSIALDHLVVFTDDPDRTIESYATLGLEVRRVRDVGGGRTQTFFRAGEPIIELVGPIPDTHGERFWGLAVTVADIDACAAFLGDRLGRIKDAVQPGRRIATLRHEACGLSVPIAFMST
jgi:glyoxalase/bleomycin resistance protein/dioxygenase superfamily protein